MKNDSPYPRKMAALRGFSTYTGDLSSTGVGIIMNVCGAGFDFNEIPSYGLDKEDIHTRDGDIAPHHPKKGVEDKHIAIWEKVLKHLKIDGLITKPYQSRFVNGIEAFLIAGEYYNTGG